MCTNGRRLEERSLDSSLCKIEVESGLKDD